MSNKMKLKRAFDKSRADVQWMIDYVEAEWQKGGLQDNLGGISYVFGLLKKGVQGMALKLPSGLSMSATHFDKPTTGLQFLLVEYGENLAFHDHIAMIYLIRRAAEVEQDLDLLEFIEEHYGDVLAKCSSNEHCRDCSGLH